MEELFGDWEDALTELEDRLRNEEVDRLEHDYPALKDINPDGWLYEWLMNTRMSSTSARARSSDG